MLGPDYEIVLQDLSDSHNCVAAIENGSISGRKIGSPITDAALRLLKKEYMKQLILSRTIKESLVTALFCVPQHSFSKMKTMNPLRSYALILVMQDT